MNETLFLETWASGCLVAGTGPVGITPTEGAQGKWKKIPTNQAVSARVHWAWKPCSDRRCRRTANRGAGSTLDVTQAWSYFVTDSFGVVICMIRADAFTPVQFWCATGWPCCTLVCLTWLEDGLSLSMEVTTHPHAADQVVSDSRTLLRRQTASSWHPPTPGPL